MELVDLLQQDAKEAVARVCVAGDTDIILFNARVGRKTQEMLLRALRGRRLRPNVLLLLLTEGGDPNAAYKIARMLQQFYERLTCFTPAYSKSAATIILIGAHELVMGDDGEMGPVDVQLPKKDTLAEHESGLIVLTALQTLHEKAYLAWEHFFLAMEQKSDGSIALKTAAHVAAELATGLFSPVYAQINPLQLGEAARAMLIGNEYGVRLNRVAKNLRPGALDRLVTGYPDHSFVIDRSEAETLFYRVRRATELESELSQCVEQHCEVEVGRQTPLVGFLNEPPKDEPAGAEATKEGENGTESDGPGALGGGPEEIVAFAGTAPLEHGSRAQSPSRRNREAGREAGPPRPGRR